MAREAGNENAEGTVEWDAASDFFNGKEAAGQPAAEGSDQGDGLVEVHIKGKTVRMQKEAADAYAEFVRETRERDGRLGGELSNLRERSARLEGMIESVNHAGKPAQADTDILPPPAKLAIENFEEWQRQMLAYNGAMMLRQQTELEGKYAEGTQRVQAQASKDAAQLAWAERFYSLNPHLNKPRLRDIVTNVYRRNFAEIDAMTSQNRVQESHERLAELADAEIVAIKSDGQRIDTDNHQRKQPPRLEGPGAQNGKEAERSPAPVTSASWSAKKRAELRGEKRK